MRKLKLALLLPLTQAVVAAILLWRAGPPDFYVPTPKLICWGLNAPAILFRIPASSGPTSGWMPGSIWGVDTSDLFFLAGVIVIWYFVGRALDQRRRPGSVEHHKNVIWFFVCPLLLAVGGFLVYLGLITLHDESSYGFLGFGFVSYRPYRGILTLIWAFSLIFMSIRGLARAIRHFLPKSHQSESDNGVQLH